MEIKMLLMLKVVLIFASFSPFPSLLSLLLLHFLSLVLPLFFMIEREGESEEWLSG